MSFSIEQCCKCGLGTATALGSNSSLLAVCLKFLKPSELCSLSLDEWLRIIMTVISSPSGVVVNPEQRKWKALRTEPAPIAAPWV
jgi:hypothetical protein